MNPFRALTFTAVLGVVVMACAKVPYTGRVQYNLIPEAVMNGVGRVTYQTMLSEAKVQKRGENVTILNSVGDRLSVIANKPKYRWEYNLINDDQMNAWALPGGYIGFYTGILPTLENESGMAFVMGHEVGHALAHHGSERMSQQLTLLGGLAGLNAYLAGNSKLTPEQRAIVVGALGVGAQFGVMLPFSRSHESEADVIGMMMMAKAGYPPGESIEVWKRMARDGGAQVPAFLSTHPSPKKRQENLREWLPQANKRYERNKLARDTQTAIWRQ